MQLGLKLTTELDIISVCRLATGLGSYFRCVTRTSLVSVPVDFLC